MRTLSDGALSTGLWVSRGTVITTLRDPGGAPMAAYKPLILTLERDDHERLAVIALLRGRDISKADVAERVLREWLAGAGQKELAEAADKLAGPRLQSAG